jgi:uncharacterized membrane protein YcaP (DUF421 family)
MELFPGNWAPVFASETPVLELIARGSILYVAVLVLIRLMPRRAGGELATMDLVFAVLIAESAARALGEYSSIVDGLIVIATLMAWNYLLNLLSFRIPSIEQLVSAPPLQVVRKGKLLRRNMRRELLTEEELMEQLRKQGIDEIKDVRAAYVESEGNVTAIREKK